MEIWKDMYGFENLYEISTYGRVRSKDRIVIDVNGRKMHYKSKMMKLQYKKIKGSTYFRVQVNLWKNNKCFSKTVSRLVALTFIPNPDNLPQVNHKDEDPTNNNISNLEWCDAKYNVNYGTRNERANKAKYKKVKIYDENFNYIKTCESIKQAASEVNGDDSSVTKVCKFKNSNHKGYIFRYV